MSLLSVAIAFWALYKANQVSNQQAEAAAPVLAPGTPLEERGGTMTVATDYALVKKRADRMFLDRAQGRLVIPLRNGGSGIALTVGRPVVVADCTREPSMLPASAVEPPLGSYVVPSGASDQLGFLQPHSQMGPYYLNKQLWYSFEYRRFGVDGNKSAGAPDLGNLLVWYTDGAQRGLRWSCITYVSTPNVHGSEWAPYATLYGTRAMVGVQPRTH